VHEFLADLRPESVIAEGAPDNGGDIFRCESDPQIGALGAAIQRHVSDRPKSDVRAQAPAGRWWLNPWLSALRDWICIMRPVSSEPGRTTLGAADAESSPAEWLKKFKKAGEDWFCLGGEAFTPLTTEPGPDVAPIHDRQMVILERADWRAWPQMTGNEAELLRALPAGSLEVEQVR
jgi:hypothetical protein